jgi:hypothetical protein
MRLPVSIRLAFAIAISCSSLHAQFPSEESAVRECNSSAKATDIVRISSGVAAGRVLKMKEASIRNELARKARNQKLIVVLDVDPMGRPSCVALLRSGVTLSDEDAQELVKEVLAAAQESQFRPYILNGAPVTFKTYAALKIKAEKGTKPSSVAMTFGPTR